MPRKRIHKKAPKSYTGGLQYPLVGAATIEEFFQKISYFGDLQSPKNRVKIMGKARFYKFEIHLFTKNGIKVQEYARPVTKLDTKGLAQVIHQVANDTLRELRDMPEADTVDIGKSFFIARLTTPPTN